MVLIGYVTSDLARDASWSGPYWVYHRAPRIMVTGLDEHDIPKLREFVGRLQVFIDVVYLLYSEAERKCDTHACIDALVSRIKRLRRLWDETNLLCTPPDAPRDITVSVPHQVIGLEEIAKKLEVFKDDVKRVKKLVLGFYKPYILRLLSAMWMETWSIHVAMGKARLVIYVSRDTTRYTIVTEKIVRGRLRYRGRELAEKDALDALGKHLRRRERNARLRQMQAKYLLCLEGKRQPYICNMLDPWYNVLCKLEEFLEANMG